MKSACRKHQSGANRGTRTARIGFPCIALLATLTLSLVTASSPTQAKDKRDMVVQTYNVYLGSSLDDAINAGDATEFIIAVATIYGTVLFTDFPSRAQAIADQIAEDQPDLIGLQEISLWTTTGPAPPGFDFLAILLQALADRGLSYSVGAVSNNANIGPVPLAPPLCAGPFGACTVSLLDRDVILVNDDTAELSITDSQSGNYVAQAVLNTPVGPLSFNRGWAFVDGTFEGKKFRFVDTHLETQAFPAVQEEQGREFLEGPAKAGGAVIAVGDFNSDADGSSTSTYADLTKSYFDDAWSSDEPGYTCCQNGTLTNPDSELNSAIDFVLTHAASRALDAKVVGDMPFQMVPPFWPSDHAGVVATIRIH